MRLNHTDKEWIANWKDGEARYCAQLILRRGDEPRISRRDVPLYLRLQATCAQRDSRTESAAKLATMLHQAADFFASGDYVSAEKTSLPILTGC